MYSFALDYRCGGTVDGVTHVRPWARDFLSIPGFKPVIDREALAYYLVHGYLPKGRTWFEGVWSFGGLLPVVEPMNDAPPDDVLADELGRLIRLAVEKCCAEANGARVGQFLSGGFDSRGIFASLPGACEPIPCITYGMNGCDDIRVAKMISAMRPSRHDVIEVNESNWLDGLQKAVWMSDGACAILNMAFFQFMERAAEKWDFGLSGYMGDAIPAGWHLRTYPNIAERDIIASRGYNFIAWGERLISQFVNVQQPYMEDEFLRFCLSIPKERRRAGTLYRMALERTYPKFYNAKINRQFDLAVDWEKYLRGPNAAKQIGSALLNPDAAYREYVPGNVGETLWKEHQAGKNNSRKISEMWTLEVWLQQVFGGERP